MGGYTNLTADKKTRVVNRCCYTRSQWVLIGMKTSIQRTVLTLIPCALLNTLAFAERLDLGEGLSIEQPTTSTIFYQRIPSYNSSKKMLQKRNEEKLLYFINIDRLPRGSNNAERYFERLLNDVSDTNTPDSLKIIDQGKYWTANNVQGTYVEYLFIPLGATNPQHHIAHFLTNTYRTYIATAVLLSTESEQQMHDDSMTLFQSASISTTNLPLQRVDNTPK